MMLYIIKCNVLYDIYVILYDVKQNYTNGLQTTVSR